jgi:drug/metabolite transporter (DMT)-like permease
VSGGIVAPLLLVSGLARTSAASASLVLNLEAAFTAALAAAFFAEHLGRRAIMSVGIMTLGAVLLAGGGRASVEPLGLAMVAVACLGWALDNNLTREIAGADAVTIAAVKGGFAGTVNLTIALASGGELPGPAPTIAALAAGALGYGVSLVLFVRALGDLGAARTAAFFAAAPLFGALGAVVVLGEPFSRELGMAALLLGAGALALALERHGHVHRHEALEHRHRHVHDEHHRHVHEASEGPEPHDHVHRHEPFLHDHPHLPDLHHRHAHRRGRWGRRTQGSE